MIRRGASTSDMRPVTADDLFFSGLKLLIVMAKARLKDFPLGDFRKRAVKTNANFVFYEALCRCNQNDPSAPAVEIPAAEAPDAQVTHLFLQRVQLLAVMCKSFAEGNPLDTFRRKALANNINRICDHLTDQIELADVSFLKVA